MNTAVERGVAGVRQRVTAAEWQVRVDLAACYRLVALHRWDDLVVTHLTARVPHSAPGTIRRRRADLRAAASR